ncbi:cobyrinate a,c-diamide synthase [Anoxybacterium hadale]|uniref:Cobyrinate a,c-diamide synthase n=2 Tax=Anoxybacterium hadale TaxID=3408580 RepID=A0ACD1AHF8_9FIRM|nr:cobyrinate a,c-diamide synthase [Clostridiales bacterium]
MGIEIPRIMIAAAGSGSGKTTVVCGLLQAFLNRGVSLASFKCGPDYIDPMFHTEALGVKSRNLDLFFCHEEMVKYLLCKNAEGADLALMEGVMGYYDGLAGKSTDASSYDLAVKTGTPVTLIVDCKGMSVSIAALIKGFLEFRQNHQIKGVVLNRLAPMLYGDVKEIIEKELGIEVFGYLPVMTDCSLESRHLGLVTAKEIGNLKEILSRLAEQMEQTINLDRILTLAREAPQISWKELPDSRGVSPANWGAYPASRGDILARQSPFAGLEAPSMIEASVRIAVAQDKAFCFYYQDNLELLQELGAEIVPFSPLEDPRLPQGISGLILGGGYPELYLEKLSCNKSMLADIKEAIGNGLPCIAECGGFMYLHEMVKGTDGNSYPLAGVIAGESYPTEKLTRFGYITLTAAEDNLLCIKGRQIRGHEFHYWDSTNTGAGMHAEKPLRKTAWDCVITEGNLWAGYPHIHFYSNPEAAVRFIKASRDTSLKQWDRVLKD